jgi:hypothetical protein
MISAVVGRGAVTDTRLRPAALPATQRGRTLLQPAQQFRGLATRYSKRAAYYQAELTIAAIILRLR